MKWRAHSYKAISHITEDITEEKCMAVIEEKKARSMVSHKVLVVASPAPPAVAGHMRQRIQNVPTVAGRISVLRDIAPFCTAFHNEKCVGNLAHAARGAAVEVAGVRYNFELGKALERRHGRGVSPKPVPSRLCSGIRS